MLYGKIEIYLSNNNINVEEVKNYFEIKDLSDGNEAFIDFWDAVNIGVTEPSQEQFDSISDSDVLKLEIIPQIKREASKRIVVVYPEWKQRNYTAAVAEIHNKDRDWETNCS